MNARHFGRVLVAEAYKQIRVYWGQPVNVAAEVLYPALHCATAYYTFRPFMDAGAPIRWFPDSMPYSLGAFLLTGFFGYTIFSRLLWAAIGVTEMERIGGTLEMQYMTPASRFALLLGATAGGLMRGIYLYLAFITAALFWREEWRIAHPGMLLVALTALVVPGLAFGVLINSRMLFARDFTAYATILHPVLNFLGGVRLPVPLLPWWLQTLSAALPLTWALHVVRRVLLEAATLREVGLTLGLGLAVSAACVAIGYVNLTRSERRARETGSLVLY